MLETQLDMHVTSSYLMRRHEMEEIRLSWSAIESACRNLATDINCAIGLGPRPEYIVAVATGGLIPAGIICRLLGWDIPIHCVHPKSYGKDRSHSDLRFLNPLSGTVLLDKTLIIDDVADTGITMKTIACGKLPFRAVLVVKPQAINHVDAYSILVPQDWWVVFPWEMKDDDRN